jgi:hypothetical protein
MQLKVISFVILLSTVHSLKKLFASNLILLDRLQNSILSPMFWTIVKTTLKTKWKPPLTTNKYIQWNLSNPTPEFSNILWHPTKIYGPTVVLLTKIKPEYSDILYNPTHFPGPLVCRIRQVLTSCTIRHISLVPWCVGLDRFWHPVQADTFPWSLDVSD